VYEIEYEEDLHPIKFFIIAHKLNPFLRSGCEKVAGVNLARNSQFFLPTELLDLIVFFLFTNKS